MYIATLACRAIPMIAFHRVESIYICMFVTYVSMNICYIHVCIMNGVTDQKMMDYRNCELHYTCTCISARYVYDNCFLM